MAKSELAEWIAKPICMDLLCCQNAKGKAYGGKALRNMVKKEHAAGYSILLEVETKNDNALRLYDSIGFVSVQGQDYYLWNGY